MLKINGKFPSKIKNPPPLFWLRPWRNDYLTELFVLYCNLGLLFIGWYCNVLCTCNVFYQSRDLLHCCVMRFELNIDVCDIVVMLNCIMLRYVKTPWCAAFVM